MCGLCSVSLSCVSCVNVLLDFLDVLVRCRSVFECVSSNVSNLRRFLLFFVCFLYL